MPSVTEPAEFFVVGGPVPPDRPCYVERAADRQLEDAVRAKRLCCVFGSRATGKTSLLQRVARTLRASGALVALVDLRRLAKHGEGESKDLWLRRIAERVAGELALGNDVGASWQGSEARPDANRLVEFFWDVVLTNTTAPVVVLIDGVDAAPPFAAELVAAVSGCYSRRSREPDFARLTFVLAGCVAHSRWAGESGSAIFADAVLVEPKDLSLSEAYRLAAAFGGERDLAHPLMDRIYAWTGGHPYLTQKVARGVARKGGRLEDVERVVREQLLAPSAADADPFLTHLRTRLGEGARPARRAARLLRRMAAGSKVAEPADAAVAERLWLSGAVRIDQDRRLSCRNRIIKELVTARWLKAAASRGRWAAAAALLVAALAAGGYWYTRYLPVADVATLTSPTGALAETEEAYRRLRALPGFAARAEGLWSEALARQSRLAATLADVAAVDARLRELPGQDAAADRLFGEFWLRRAREAVYAERRDEAILMLQRAASLPAADATAATYLAELVGDDYLYLERSLRLRDPPASWHMAFPRATVLSLDAEQQTLRTPFGAASGVSALGAAPQPLTALQHEALVRELVVTGDGTAGEFELSFAVQHSAGVELLVTLTGPSGAAAAVNVPRGDGAAVETFRFQATQGSPLAELADERVSGSWRLTVVDRAAGNTGVLIGWELALGVAVARDDPPEPLAIPDPVRVETVTVSAVGERAAAWPSTPGAVGTVALWDLATGRLEHDFTLRSPPRHVAINATGTRVLAATDGELSVWNVADGALVARVATETEFVLPPVFSADGGYVAIAERVEGANPLYSVLRSADASLVASIEGAPDVQQWQLGPGARYLALFGPASVLRVVETRRGTELTRLQHDRTIERALPAADGATVVTIDTAGAVLAWPVAAAPRAAPRELGVTASAASVSVSADGRRLAFTRDDGAVVVVDVTTGAAIYRLRQPRAEPIATTQLSPDGLKLVTLSGVLLRLWDLPALPPLAAAAVSGDAAPTVLALDRTADLVAVGLRSGQLQVVPAAALGSLRSSLAFFGHRGPITAAALDAASGLAATGGSDGIVRLWDLAATVPTGAVMQPADIAISLVGLSADGRFVASAGERIVRVANVSDGAVIAEIALQGVVRVLAFAPDATTIAVGDDAGAVTIAAFAPAREHVVVALGVPVRSLVFAPDGSQLAVGDAVGAVRLIGAADGEIGTVAPRWPQPVRWLDFSPDGSVLFVATDAWVHALSATSPGLAPLHSKLVAPPAAHGVSIATSAVTVRTAGLDAARAASVVDLDLAATAASAGDVTTAALVARDWPAALALRLGDDGEAAPFDP